MDRASAIDPAYLKLDQDGYAFVAPLLWFDNVNYGRLDARAAKILRLADNGISTIAMIIEEIIMLQELAKHQPKSAEEMLIGIQEQSLENIQELSRIHNELCVHLRPLDDLYSHAGQSAAEVFRQFGSSFHNAAFNAINRFLAFMFENSWDPKTQVDLLVLKNWQFSENEIRFSDLTIFPVATFCGMYDEYYIALEALNRSNGQCRAELHREAYKVTELIASAGLVEDYIGDHKKRDDADVVETPKEIVLRKGKPKYEGPMCEDCNTAMRVASSPRTIRKLKCPNCGKTKKVTR